MYKKRAVYAVPNCMTTMMSLVYILCFLVFTSTDGTTSDDNATIALETRVATLERVVGQLLTGRWDTQPADLQAIKQGKLALKLLKCYIRNCIIYF